MENTERINKPLYVIGTAQTVLDMTKVPPMKPFSDQTVDFLNALSKKLMSKKHGHSDVTTFAFWCRKAHLLSEKAKYPELDSRLGKGIVFHSTPSNVAVNFAFSFAAGILSGNANIVRLPAKVFEQVDIICNAINELLEEYGELKPYICMLKFAPDRDLYDLFSEICDCRVIWGGDNTIAEIRQSQLAPRANEITFADRFSLTIINSDTYLSLENKAEIAKNFYNDTFLTDQNACTSPRIILWYGSKISQAKTMFWNTAQVVTEKYDLQPIQAVSKLTAFYNAAVNEELHLEPAVNNTISRIKVNKLTPTLMNYKYNSGFFFEYDVMDFAELRCLFTKPCQTLSYIGFDKNELKQMVMAIRPFGLDRIVPVGKTMDFSLIWDGNDLIRSMSRLVDLV